MGPFTAYLYVTTRCNSRCSFCRIWREDSHRDLTFDVGRRTIDGLAELGVRYIDFTGGEPTLNEHLPELLEHAKRRGLFTSITTNGLLYSTMAGRLTGLLDSIGFSLNGPSAEVHDGVCGVSAFERVVAAISDAVSAGEPVHAHFTATDTSIDCLEDTSILARELGVPLVVYPEFSYFGNPRLSRDGLNVLWRVARWPGVCINTASLRFHRGGGNRTQRPACRAGTTAVALDPDGALLLPCYHRSMAALGAGTDLVETYHSEAARELIRQSGRYAFCEGCTNWCYINPSFLYPPSRLTLPYLRSSLRSLRVVYRDQWLAKAREIVFWSPSSASRASDRAR